MSTKWIMYCDGCVEEFDTQQQALDAADDAISDCNDGEWCDEVANILVAQVTHRSSATNEVRREQLDDEGCFNGKLYSGDYESWCDYEMQPADEAAKEINTLTARLAAAQAALARVALCETGDMSNSEFAKDALGCRPTRELWGIVRAAKGGRDE